MKFYHVDDVEGFFNEVNQCKGQVLLVDEEGNRLNLKSRLSKVIAYANVFSGGEIEEMEILTSDPADMTRLMNFEAYGARKVKED
ncbi:MAG: polya polymerase [Lachnospiraceae bacterium]|nr:polya polymerase [Lachnospiraceae bacterium]